MTATDVRFLTCSTCEGADLQPTPLFVGEQATGICGICWRDGLARFAWLLWLGGLAHRAWTKPMVIPERTKSEQSRNTRRNWLKSHGATA